MSQVTMDYWLSYAWNHNPNPPKGLLAARGYEATLAAVEESDTWEPVSVANPMLRMLTFPVPRNSQIQFQDKEQCDLLRFPLNSLE